MRRNNDEFRIFFSRLRRYRRQTADVSQFQLDFLLPNTTTTTPTNSTEHPDLNVGRNATVMLLLICVILIFVPLGVLGTAIDWPNNLDQGAEYNLPL